MLLVSIGLISLLFLLLQTIPQQHRQPKNTTQTVRTQKPVYEQRLPQKAAVVGESKSSQKASATFQDTKLYRTIIDNDLFRPLGWTPPRPRYPYRLLGTLIPRDGKSKAQAILQRTPTGKTYAVTIGDQLDTDTTVTDIQPKQVTLSKSGVMRTLKLNATPLIK